MATQHRFYHAQERSVIDLRSRALDVRRRVRLVLRKAGFLLVDLLGIYLMLLLLLHPWYTNWGATAAEQEQALPGDEFIPDARTQVTRAVAIDAPPEVIWPWLMQMGVDRAGLYTYTWFENGVLRLDVTNADKIVPRWQDLKIGDIVAYTPEDYPTGRTGPLVIAMEPKHALIMCGGDSAENCPRTWQIVLEEQADGSTRLLARWRSSVESARVGVFGEMPLEIGYFVMERKMHLGIKERAEKNNDSVSITP
jgi:hypothetical protein